MPISPYQLLGHPGRQSSLRPPGRWSGGARATLALLLPALLLLAACSTESRYRAYCFLIDGVPPRPANASAEPKPGSLVGQPAPRQWASSVHKPYADFQCAKCHNIDAAGGAMQGGKDFVIMRPEAGLCAPCHRAIPGEPPFAHAPVLLKACQWCHLPHESRYPALLRASPEEVCFRCHWEEELSPGPHHLRPFAGSGHSCLDCHRAHGGDRRFFLKAESNPDPPPEPGVSPEVPGTRPPSTGQPIAAPVAAEGPDAKPL